MVLKHHNKRAGGTFKTHQEAEVALCELRDSGFLMAQVSVIGRNLNPQDPINEITPPNYQAEASKQPIYDTEIDKGSRTGAITGGTVGGLTGLLVGLGAITIPGLGSIMLGGAVATVLATTLAGGAIGAASGGLVGGLIGLGIPEDCARVYNDRVSKGEYLVMVEGAEDEIRRAEAILRYRGIQEWGIFDAPVPDRDQSVFTSGGIYPPGTPYLGHQAANRGSLS